MGEATGLGPLEIAVLECVEALTRDGSPTRTQRVLDELELRCDIGGRYAVLAIQDLGVPWQTLVQLVDLQGNWGFGMPDAMADPQYTLVRLSNAGRLALAAERGELGPVPVGMLNGTVYRGGRVPSLNGVPALRLVEARMRGRVLSPDLGGLIRLATDGLVLDGLDELKAGDPARVVCSSRIDRLESQRVVSLVITGTPPRHDIEEVQRWIHRRTAAERHVQAGDRRYAHYLPEDQRNEAPAPGSAGIADIRNESRQPRGSRLVLELTKDADADVVEEWVRSLWPVTTVEDWHVPGGLARLVDTWADRCRADPTGLTALQDLLQ